MKRWLALLTLLPVLVLAGVVNMSGARLFVEAGGGGDPPEGIPQYIVDATAGEWTQVASTSDFQAIEFTGWGSGAYSGKTGDYTQMLSVWTGAAFDVATARMFVTGGGHASHNGNDIYCFDFSTGEWSRVNDPSPYNEDENVNGLLPDGLPQAIHTYGSVEYDPASGKLLRLGTGGSGIGKVWEFDPTVAAWPISYATSLSSGWAERAAEFIIETDDSLIYDPATLAYYGGNNVLPGASGFFSPRKYVPATDTKSSPGFGGSSGFGNGFAPGGGYAMGFDHESCEAYIVGGNNGGTGSYVERGTVKWNVCTGQWTDLTASTTGTKTMESATKYALAYDEYRNQFWGWNGGDLYILNTSTLVWSTISPPSDPPAYNNGTYTRMRYIPQYDVLALITGSGLSSRPSVYVYKPTSWRYAE